MATRAATFTAKIHTLSDYHFRIRHGILPQPSGIDIANTLKYFSQTLLSVLKDVPSIPVEIMRRKSQDHVRLGLFPNLDYKGLHYVLVQLVEIVPLMQQGVHVLGQSLLHTMVCLVPFLEHDLINTLPNLVASTMTIFPTSLYKDIIVTLCNHLLPYSITDGDNSDNRNHAVLSVSSILMTVFQYSKDQTHHCQLLECLMSLKRDILKDLLCVIAHGTAVARTPATSLLFLYWPSLIPVNYDRRGNQNNLLGWKPLACQRENCLSGDNNDAVKMCLDPAIAIGTGDHPPPLYICQGCCDQICSEAENTHLVDVLLPIQQISLTCENKSCRSNDKAAICMCFAIECACYNGNRPIRYCSQCHTIRHNNRRGADHVCHVTPLSLGKSDPEMLMYSMEAIVSLLKEAQPIADRNLKESADQHIRATLLNPEEQVDFAVLEERRMLSRYGIYLLVSLCCPDEETLPEILGRMLAMLFQWFDATAYFRDDQSGGLLERLKSECIQKFLVNVCKSHFEVFVSCLLPHPPDYARVGGHWDTVTSRTGHIKEGFNRLFCLVPYEIINLEVWDYIMGHWMEAIRTEVPEQELIELKMLLSKVLDPEMSPLGFDAHHMYKFFAVRFQNTSAVVQEQALKWLQILCELDVVVPLSLLYSMFNDGIQAIKSAGGDDTSQPKPSSYRGPPQFANSVISNEDASDEMQPTSSISSGEQQMNEQKVQQQQQQHLDSEANISCFVLMLDILLKQLDLQEVDLHQGLDHIVSKETLSLMQEMIKAPWAGKHTCQDENSFECNFCEYCTIFYQFSLELIEFISPTADTPDLSKYKVPEQDVENEEVSHSRMQSYDESFVVKVENTTKPEVAPKLEQEPKHESREIESVSAIPIMTATVQTVMDTELHTVSLIPTEEVVKAVANAVTLSEMDVGVAKVCVAQATIVDENEQPICVPREMMNEEEGTFWQTTQGKFKFTLDELPLSLQYIYLLFKELTKYEEADVLYHILSCLKVLFFNAECLSKAARENRGFLIWSEENLFINNLWTQLRLDHSHVAQIGVQLLLHCLTLPSGADTFWKVLEENFHSKDWKIRFASVEKVTAIGRFLDSNLVYHSQWVQSSLSNAFSYLINCLDDISPHVSDRTSLYLDTIQNSTLKCLCWCLEVQFDSVIIDRPMILQALFQLYNCLPNRSVLTWDFFLNRFDTLYLEAQVSLEKSGDIAYPKDLKNTDSSSEVFTQKLNRAHEAINHFGNQSLRSLSASLGPKLRYKRTLSAPCGLIYKQDKLVDKEKVFNRQYSAPVLKRKSSKFGVTHIHHPLVAHFPNHLFPDGHLQEQSHDEQSFLTTFHKLMEMEEYDHDTLHLLIFLLMQFMSQPDHAYPTDEKSVAKVQNVVLRHLNLLLGYSSQDKGFVISPAKMRNSPIFNAYLSNLPRVLDRNFKMGTLLLPMCMTLLQYCPAPVRTLAEAAHINYSLWSMDSMARHYWLQAVSIIVYKYRYNSIPISKQVISLLRIVLNVLSSHNHRCRDLLNSSVSTILGVRQYSKDTSTVNVGELINVQDKETPPYSPSPRPNAGSEGVVVTIATPAEWKVHYRKLGSGSVEESDGDHLWKHRKLQEMNFPSDIDDAEPELEAIPESPKTESPQAESLQESIGELENVNEGLAESAVIRVERGVTLRPEVGITIVNPPLEHASQAVVTTAPLICYPPAVEERMAQQLQAFDQSFDRGKDVTTEPMLKPLEMSVKDNLRKKRERMAIRTDDTSIFSSDDSEDTFVRHMTVKSDTVYIAKLVTMPPPQEIESNNSDSSGASEPWTHSMKARVVSGKPKSHCKLEVLDAGLLETSVLRREPAVVSQIATQSSMAPYLFQPIQSHPITSKEKISLEERSVKQPEVKKTFPPSDASLDVHLASVCDGANRSPITQSPPWTVEIHHPIQLASMLPPMPSPERLLSFGLPQSERPREAERNPRGPPPPVPPKRITSKELSEIPYADDEASLHQQPSLEDERLPKLATSEDISSDKFEMVSETPDVVKSEAVTALQPVLSDQAESRGSRSLFTHVAACKKRPSHPHLEAVVVDVPVRILEPLITHVEYETVDVQPNAATRAINEVSKLPGDEQLMTSLSIESEKVQYSEPHVVMPAAVFHAPLTMWASSSSQVKSVTSGAAAEHLLLPPGVLALTDHTNLKKSQTTNDGLGITGTIQRLYPSFRRSQESQVKIAAGIGSSPRSLTKPFDPHQDSSKDSADGEEIRVKGHFRQRRQKENRNAGNRKSKKGEYSSGGSASRSTSQPQTSQKLAEEVMVDRCPECGVILEHYSDEELGLCVVILATCIHREPALVAPLLPEILHTVARIASDVMYPWETETNIYLPGNGRSVARQFIRCVLHQLAPSGVFIQLFESSIVDPSFFKTVVLALSDFNELNPLAPLQILLEGLNERKTLPVENITRVMNNMAVYMDSLQLETPSAAWANILPQFDIFLRRLVLVLPVSVDITSTLHIICSILHIQTLSGFKGLLDPFSKIISFAIQNCSFKYRVLLEMCHLCNRAFSKERDKLYLSRTVIFELVQALKFKTSIPDENLWKLVQFVVQDAGGTLGPSVMVEDPGTSPWNLQNMINTSASECMRQYFTEALDFISDVHTLGKIKSNFKGTLVGLNEDTLGGTLKAGVAQYLALEITRGNNRENRAINRYLPWLYNPLPAVQQGPKEFIDCIMHIRLLSWLLLGSLIHMVVVGTNSNLVCQPIPMEASGHVADHVQVILAGFAEQSKASVLHMSSLFHAFILCQLWTMYCEQLTALNVPGSEHYHVASMTTVDFWAKVTPGLLQLVSHSKVLAEMVTLHFLSLIEALIECNSTVLAKLFAMWRPVLNSYNIQLPGHLVVRLQACENRPPPAQTKDEAVSTGATLLKWVQRLQFKMGQIELQSSAATQFYSV